MSPMFESAMNNLAGSLPEMTKLTRYDCLVGMSQYITANIEEPCSLLYVIYFHECKREKFLI